jgi:hypothetical protein
MFHLQFHQGNSCSRSHPSRTENTVSDRIAYPALPNPLHPSDLVRLFTPKSVEIDWACSITRSERTRCHVLMLLMFFQTLGRFMAHAETTHRVVEHIAQCVGLPEANASVLNCSRPTFYRPQHLVSAYMGISRWNADGQQRVENTIEELALVRIHPTNCAVVSPMPRTSSSLSISSRHI